MTEKATQDKYHALQGYLNKGHSFDYAMEEMGYSIPYQAGDYKTAEQEIRHIFEHLNREAEELKSSGELMGWWGQQHKLIGLRLCVEIFDKHQKPID